MRVTVITFPGDGRPKIVDGEGESIPLSEVLSKAEATPVEGENADIAVDGALTRDMTQAVRDGAIVTKTKRVAGA